MAPTISGLLAGAAVATAGVAAAQPEHPAETRLQLPGLIVAANPANGAALVQPTVAHGNGTIRPTPPSYGYVYTW
ncbi:hypothetical protein [Nocardia rhizosphaerae]|uniref:Uncharacterized protein n=1 Tax=Nocardia rhizosphaerae TaxID=1691571 RepID=A0ABV8L1L4_9NOCA